MPTSFVTRANRTDRITSRSKARYYNLSHKETSSKMSDNLNLAQLRIIRSSLLFSKSHLEQKSPQLTKDLLSVLEVINAMIINRTWALERGDYED